MLTYRTIIHTWQQGEEFDQLGVSSSSLAALLSMTVEEWENDPNGQEIGDYDNDHEKDDKDDNDHHDDD